MRWLFSAGRSWTVPKIQIEFSACFLLALGLLLLPLDWMVAGFLAAAVHEMSHYAAAHLLGVSVYAIRADFAGLQMELSPLTPREEWMVAAAGPVASLLLTGTVSVYPQLAVCGLAHGIYNLLPVWPMDGGRILRGLFPGREELYSLVEIGVLVILMSLGIWLWIGKNLGILPLCMVMFLTVKAFRRKIPCIADKEGVQ